MARADRWDEHGAALLEQEAEVRAESGRERQDQPEDHAQVLRGREFVICIWVVTWRS